MSEIEPIRHSITLDASIERVWRALTTPAEVAEWLGPIGFEARVGAQFHFKADPQGEWDGVTYSEMLELEAPTRMKFSWFVPGVPKTFVTFTLRDLGVQTEVTLEHSGWDQLPPEVKPIRDQLDFGWSQGVLPNLYRVVTGKATGK